MPTYDYACAACGHEFEKFESITAKPTRECPKCHKKKAERRISAGGGFLFKGSGFYVTDYKKSGGGEKKETSDKPAAAKPCCAGGTCSAHGTATPVKGKADKVA